VNLASVGGSLGSGFIMAASSYTLLCIIGTVLALRAFGWQRRALPSVRWA
jgi:hypothetical protein